MSIKDKIVYYAYKYEGDWSKISLAIKSNEEVKQIKYKDNFITFFDDLYPIELRKLRFPPWVIFYKGDISLLNRKCISIVGSRNACSYGIDITKKIVLQNKDKVIVSGLAKGIDAIAHEEAIKITKTIAVIGSGLEYTYPLCNKYLYDILGKEHLIISEYPYHTKVKKHHFPWRNRIIACLSETLYVTQARIQSGTMLTVNEAINLSKEIWSVPYPIYEEEGKGCNLIISQGANILIDV